MSRMLVRRFTPDDRDAVRDIHAQAFAREEEADLFGALLDAGDDVSALSFVAERDGELVGHVVCSRATVGEHEVVALGPIGVLPAHQRKGFGDALMHATLGAADALDIPLVVLLGHLDYYPRFGFVPAAPFGIEPPAPWGDHFMLRKLSSYDPAITGLFRYAPAFTAAS
jgi:putative acetyltransferase